MVMLSGILVIVIGIFIIDCINNKNHSNSRWCLVGIAILLFFGIPLLTEYFGLIKGASENRGDWLSFWGSYIGVIPSGVVALLVTRLQIEATKKNDRVAHMIDMYIDDLRAMQKEIIQYSYKGYGMNVPGVTYSGQEVSDTLADMLNNNTISNIEAIAFAFPTEKAQEFKDMIRNLKNEIIFLKEISDEELIQNLDMLSIEFQMADIDREAEALNNWEEASFDVAKQLNLINDVYNRLTKHLEKELASYNRLEY